MIGGPYRSTNIVRKSYTVGPTEIKEAIGLWLKHTKNITLPGTVTFDFEVDPDPKIALLITVSWGKPK